MTLVGGAPPTSTSVAARWILATIALLLAGCGGGTSMRLESLDQKPVLLQLALRDGVYVVHPSETSVVLSDLPWEELAKGRPEVGQVLHAQLLWVPKPGYTPVDSTATNVTLRWIVFSGGEVGVYGGAGFCWPSGRIGKDALSVRVEASTLSLIASTKGFVDLASPAAISGRFVAAYDPEQALRARQQVSQLVTDALGRTYWVDEGGGSSWRAMLASRPSASISEGSAGSPSNSAGVARTTRR